MTFAKVVLDMGNTTVHTTVTGVGACERPIGAEQRRQPLGHQRHLQM